jgi:hypothetical protein
VIAWPLYSDGASMYAFVKSHVVYPDFTGCSSYAKEIFQRTHGAPG